MKENIVGIPVPAHITPHNSKLNFGPATGAWIAKVISEGGIQSYERPTLAAIMALMEYHGSTVQFVDVGANIFIYPLVARAVFGLEPEIIAFEPHPLLVKIGLKLIKTNQLPFRIVGKAVADKDEEGILYLSAKADTSNSLVKGFREELGQVKVDIVSLDTYFEKHEGNISVIKIDTETNEPAVLKGAEALIEKHRPWIICEVLYGITEEPLMEVMEKHKYEYYMLSEDMDETWEPRTKIIGDRKYILRDWLFAPREIDEDIKTLYNNWITALQH